MYFLTNAIQIPLHLKFNLEVRCHLTSLERQMYR